jgi:uncharacterized protein YkwD
VTATATLPPSSTPVTPTVAGQGTLAASSTPGAAPAADCDFEENSAYVTELQTLINDARTDNNLSALSVNTQLTAAAKNHAIDMLCNNYFSHIALDKSTPQERVAKAGFTASLVAENIYASLTGDPQAAFDWWMSIPENREGILNANTTVVGIAYVESGTSLFGSYFVVVSAKP